MLRNLRRKRPVYKEVIYLSEYQLQLKDDELAHYGVLGMKWGIRRGNIDRVYDKSVKKQQKLNKRVDKAYYKYTNARVKANTGVSKKYHKLQYKADKLQARADAKKRSIFVGPKKAAEYQVKADRAQTKANKYKAHAEKQDMKARRAETRYIKAGKKAEKWAKQRQDVFLSITKKDFQKQEYKHKMAKGNRFAQKAIQAGRVTLAASRALR